MLKWAVNSRRGEGQTSSRLSLDAGPPCRRRNRRDKENMNRIGRTQSLRKESTPHYRKFESTTNGALKDVSNITPKSLSPIKRRISKNNNDSAPSEPHFCPIVDSNYKDPSSVFAMTPTSCVPRNIVPIQPFLKKRRILLDTDIYVDVVDSNNDQVNYIDPLSVQYCVNNDNLIKFNSVRRSSQNKDGKINTPKSLPNSEINNTDENKRLSEETDSKFYMEKHFSNDSGIAKSIIHAESLPTFEIEYSPCILGGTLRPNDSCDVLDEANNSTCLSTLPVIGSRIFIKNPLYFNMEDFQSKVTVTPNKKPKLDMVENFSSLINKLSPLSALRQNGCKQRTRICSEVSPLAKKLASLCFNKINFDDHSTDSGNISNRKIITPTKLMKRRPLIAHKDDEVSIEMETKMISDKVALSDSTMTDSKMGDVTLEKMIEDILKSTKKVRRARKVKLNTKHDELKNASLDESSSDDLMANDSIIGKIPSKRINIVRFQTTSESELCCENKRDVKNTHQSKSGNQNVDIFGVLPEDEKTYIMYDSLNFNEREVKTPENKLSSNENVGFETMLKGRLENCSLLSTSRKNSRKRSNSLDFTPAHNSSINRDCDFNLKRQRCVRRKRNCQRVEETIIPNKEKESGLTLQTGIPSPFTPENKSISRLLESNSYNSVTGYPFFGNIRQPSTKSRIYLDENSCPSAIGQISSPTLNHLHFKDAPPTNVSNSSFMLGQYSAEKKPSLHRNRTKMFGLTLESGIPSPSSPFASDFGLNDFNLNTPGFYSSSLNDSSVHKVVDDSVDIVSEPVTPVAEFRSSRRCLTYSPDEADLMTVEDSGIVSAPRSRNTIGQYPVSSGTIDLSIQYRDNQITVHIIRCRNLRKPSGSTKQINAYVKVSATGTPGYRRTPVRRDTSSPQYDRDLVVPLATHKIAKEGSLSSGRLNFSVWHRDSSKRRSEFLGCTSFLLRHVLRRDINGCFQLVPQAAGRCSRAPPFCRPIAAISTNGGHHVKMAASGEIGATLTTGNGSAKEPDDFNREQGDSGVGGRLASQQREADEHLFLRYLELDPIEGPDAAPAAVQRKASGNKAGRTPFTTTRRLDRGGDQGFGFSVLWTRPPRIERVDPGRAADRAGLHPGDYIVFVDRHNVVTLPESQVLTLIKSSGSQLILETFRRSTHGGEIRAAARGSLTSHLTLSDAAPCSPRPLLSLHHHLQNQLQAQSQSQSQSQSQQSAGNRDSGGDWSQARAGRPSTACSNNTATSAASRRRPTLPQVAFTRESMTALGSTCGGTGIGSGERVRALQAVVAREQIYSQALQFGVERYVAPLSSRSDIITPAEHALLFQNCEELLRLSEDILEQLVSEEGEVQIHLVASVYLAKMPTIISLYKTYCNGLKRADCVLVQKSRQQGGGFVRSVTEPPVPRRRPDVTQLVHKPLEQFRELLRLLRAARAAVPASHSDHPALARLVNDLQNAYHEVTASAGLMGPLGEGRPLLSVADLESRLVFTRCKPFILSKPGRQWIFGGDLGRVEGRTVRPFWGLLFTDLLLFATVSRDRVLFITEEPLAIANITETCFNIRKRTNEFRLGVGAGRAGSPTARCGPPARTRARTLALRAPSADLKAVWQSLLLRQICRVNSSTGTPLSSPMESPAPLGCYSEVTLDSQQRQVPLASALGPRSRLTSAHSNRNLENNPSETRHHSVSFASTGAVYDSISRLSGITFPCSNNRTVHKDEFGGNAAQVRSFEMLNDRISEEVTDANSNGQNILMPSEYQNQNIEAQNGAKTPDTPPPNVSPGESSKNSQTFSSHFVSLTSLDRGNSEDNNYSPHKRILGYSDTPSSPSAVLTPSTTDFGLDCRKHDHFGEHCILDAEDPEIWDTDALCRWESFEADLALADLNMDPCFKTDVEENIYFRDDFFSPSKSNRRVQDSKNTPQSLDL